MAKDFSVISGQIVRSPKVGAVRYTPLLNSVLQNTQLSFEARGLLSYLLSLPTNWLPVKAKIVSDHKHLIGESKFNRIWSELTEHGYIISERVKDPASGKFLGWCHVVFEETSEENTEYGKNRCRIIPSSDNHPITNNTTTTKERSEQSTQSSNEIPKGISLSNGSSNSNNTSNTEEPKGTSPLEGDVPQEMSWEQQVFNAVETIK